MSSATKADYTADQWHELCQSVRSQVPQAVGTDTWYLIIAAILTSSPTPELLGPFYTHLTKQQSVFFQSSQEHLSLRFRDLLLKLTTLIGAPRVLGALIPLATAEGDPATKASASTLDPKWDTKTFDLAAIEKRGEVTINSIYGPLLPKIFSNFGANSADFAFYETALVYGLYLSDHTVLTALETEVAVYVTILCVGLRGPSLWHTRGLGRLLGARGTDESTREMGQAKDVVRAVKTAALAVVDFLGTEMERRVDATNWPNVGDVGRELGGWGDDG